MYILSDSHIRLFLHQQLENAARVTVEPIKSQTLPAAPTRADSFLFFSLRDDRS